MTNHPVTMSFSWRIKPLVMYELLFHICLKYFLSMKCHRFICLMCRLVCRRVNVTVVGQPFAEPSLSCGRAGSS